MGDDTCNAHAHYAGEKRYFCHHFYPRNGEWHCSGCPRVTQSVISRDVGRKHKDRVEP